MVRTIPPGDELRKGTDSVRTRNFLSSVALLGAIALAACSQSGQPSVTLQPATLAQISAKMTAISTMLAEDAVTLQAAPGSNPAVIAALNEVSATLKADAPLLTAAQNPVTVAAAAGDVMLVLNAVPTAGLSQQEQTYLLEAKLAVSALPVLAP